MSLPMLFSSALPVAWAALEAAAPASGPAGSGLALFLLGLITGVAGAVIASFAWIHATLRSRDGLSGLEAAPGEGEPEGEIGAGEFGEAADSPSSDPHQRPGNRMPWERPEDWWRGES